MLKRWHDHRDGDHKSENEDKYNDKESATPCFVQPYNWADLNVQENRNYKCKYKHKYNSTKYLCLTKYELKKKHSEWQWILAPCCEVLNWADLYLWVQQLCHYTGHNDNATDNDNDNYIDNDIHNAATLSSYRARYHNDLKLWNSDVHGTCL